MPDVDLAPSSEGRDRTRLEQVDRVARERPLHVGRLPEARLRLEGEGSDRHDLGIGERRERGPIGGDRHALGASVVGEHRHAVLVADAAVDDRAPFASDREAVGRHLARDDRLAEPEARVDHDPVGRARDRVGREGHAGRIGEDELLHHHGAPERLDTPLALVVERAGAEERRPAATDGVA